MVADVGRDDVRVAAERAHAGGDGLEPVAGAGHERHVGTLTRERLGSRRADAARGARDVDRLPSSLPHGRGATRAAAGRWGARRVRAARRPAWRAAPPGISRGMDPTPIVAVLAGGRSRRMGTAKALVPLGGRPLVLWVLDAAREAGLEAVVVAKAGSPLPAVPVPVWREPDAPVHPLAGVVAALERAPGRAVIAAACDMPWVTAGLLRALAATPARGRPRRRSAGCRSRSRALPAGGAAGAARGLHGGRARAGGARRA